ncbi:hypothetical protein [Novosphingobium sp.]|nr:hypothetical protein [Novosphingobium sp.]MBX9665950.1 hypothetical protein [Novosphingobium sp.]
MIGFIEFFNWFYGIDLWPIISLIVLASLFVVILGVGALVWDRWFRRD